MHTIVPQNNILDKLKKAKISEIKLMNMKTEAISSLEFLTEQERTTLIKRLRDFQNYRKSPRYSSSLQNVHPVPIQIFISFKKEHLLKKMKTKRVKQDKLIKLRKDEIKDFSFLTEEEKQELPLIIEQFNLQNQEEFANLKFDIEKQIQIPNIPPMLREPKSEVVEKRDEQ